MIQRTLQTKLLDIATKFPVVALLGPRQSGKTTLSKATFTKYHYVSLEDLDVRAFATNDPRAFLELHKNQHGIILDEIQNVPTILSYIQTVVDTHRIPGYFILTGSQNFLVNESITQTLAGRVAILTLLPLSIAELQKNALLPEPIEGLLYKGSYPSLYITPHITPPEWYPNYILSYLERDVRQIKNVTDLTIFKRFVQLCAGRIGQILNLTSLGNDCGISSNTAKAWLSLLEASYIIYLLHPHYKNFSKRLIKSPKIYFYDTGLACSLLGIETEKQLYTHYLRGGLVESVVISELYKAYYNAGRVPHLYFWRDSKGDEIDCIIEKPEGLVAVEIKAGKTISSDYFDGLNYWSNLTSTDPAHCYLIYAGPENQKRSQATVVSWKSIDATLVKS